MRLQLKIQFAEMREMAALNDYLLECGFETTDDNVISIQEVVEFEKPMVSV